MDRYMQCLTATNAKCSNGGRVTFFNAKSSQTGQWIQAPHRVQEARSHTLALPLGSASRGWWSAGISLGCRSPDVARGVSTKQYAALRHVSESLFLGRRRHLYVCSRCRMPIESWPKRTSRQQVEQRLTTDS